jgi:hypothetical protein
MPPKKKAKAKAKAKAKPKESVPVASILSFSKCVPPERLVPCDMKKW